MPEERIQKLFCEPAALEKPFLVADILADCYGEFYLEYGLVGLASLSRPFHIVATTILPGQEITNASVYQSGFDVLRLREEVTTLSKRLRTSLVSPVFIHRHPGPCGMSATDERFLQDVFVRQISTMIILREERDINPQIHDCVWVKTVRSKRGGKNAAAKQRFMIQYGVAFSLIVNRQREHSLDAARIEWCPLCGRTRTYLVPAKLELKPRRKLTDQEREKLRRLVEVEVEAKIRLRRKHTSTRGACV